MSRYQDVYPSPPLLDSSGLARPSAADLLTLEYFEAEPGEMPVREFSQHHILLNLHETPQRVQNLRDGEVRDFVFHRDEVVVTPAGLESGWRWFTRSKVIVITLEPAQLESFAQREVGILLSTTQLHQKPQFRDPDLCHAGLLLKEALESRDIGSEVLFESLARIFLVKLIQRYGERHEADLEPSAGFSSAQYKRVLDFVSTHYGDPIAVEDLARQAGLSPSHFSRRFKQTLGQTPHQFLVRFRIEQSRKLLLDLDKPLVEIALRCGFSDQAHFSRVFKQLSGLTPSAFRSARSSSR